MLTFCHYDAKIWLTPKSWLKLWICENLICDVLGCWFSKWIPNWVQKCWSTPTLCRQKSKLKMALVRHLGFFFQNLISDNSVLSLFFSPEYQIWCKNVDRRRNYGQKSIFKMAAVRHLGILVSPYRTTHEVFSLGYISLSNFVLIRYIVLKIWGFEFFAELAWNAYLRPQNFGFFWSVDP